MKICFNYFEFNSIHNRQLPSVRMAVMAIGAIAVFGILSWTAGNSVAGGAATQPLFNIGYQVIDLAYRENGREQVLTVAVWYPTAAQPKPHNYGGRTGGNVAVDAAPYASGGPYPFLVFSHGYGGGGISSVFFTEALAAHGWIVACPDHHDLYSAVRIRTGQVHGYDRLGLLRHGREIAASSVADRDKYRYRLDEMSVVLDSMLASHAFGEMIDKDRIAVGGHSFGAFTALGLCGTIRERLDLRIKAILLFSTGAGGYLFRENELAAVRVPSMLLMGEKETDQTRGSHTMSELSAKIFRNVSPPKYFLEVRGASHFSFNNSFANNHRTELLSGTEEQFEVIRRYSIAFLEKYVAGRGDIDHVLDQGNVMLTRYLRETLGDASKRDSAAGETAEPVNPADTDKPRR